MSSAPVNEQTATNGEVQSSVQDTMSAIGLLSNKAMAESRTNTGDKPHKLAIIESISAALTVDGRDPSKASSCQPVGFWTGAYGSPILMKTAFLSSTKPYWRRATKVLIQPEPHCLASTRT
ncbi:hypothetical protein LB505_011615 [Fusarium chuoi]|nr:hypothetical protein LB505_011615 [Fusarium chuoi]